MPRVPPKKQAEQGKKPHTINGRLLDVATFSAEQGWSPKTTRGMVARRLVPFRRLGGRVVFLRTDVTQWLERLAGCGPDEAIRNMQARQ